MDRYGLSLPRSRKGGAELEIPLWLPFVIAAAPAAWLWSHTRQRPAGRCEHCDYDLTGNISGICPECGQSAAEEGTGDREPG